MADSTPELLQSISRGDRGALERLLEQNLPRLRAFVRLRLGPKLRERETMSDVVQSVCREVLLDLGSFDYRNEAGFRNWLFTAAINKIIDKDRFYSAAKRKPPGNRHPGTTSLAECYLTMSSPSQAMVRREQAAVFERIFDQLPEDYREVITLAKLVGLSQEEIAEQMGRSVPAVRVLLHRALAKLGILLDRAADEA